MGRPHGDPRPAETDLLVAATEEFIDTHGLLSRGESVVVGVSGGADSVALLAVLRELSAGPGRGYRLTVAHLNHALRATAGDDAAFVESLAARWRVPCILATRPVAVEARRLGVGIEEAARTVRYAFLAEAAAQARATAVAVGHHGDDQAETVLYRLIRGTHLRGLAGMSPRRALGSGGVQLVRPLLGARREQIEAFCRRRELPWRTDETNAQRRYRRNFVRHELLPLLRERLNPRASEALMKLAGSAGEVEAYLAEQGAAALARARCEPADGADGLVLSAAQLVREPAVVRTYALRLGAEQAGVAAGRWTAEVLERLAALPALEPPAAVALPGDVLARREGARVRIGPSLPAGDEASWQIELVCPGSTPLPDGRSVTCRLETFDASAFRAHCSNPQPGREMLDADRLCGHLSCRTRRAGDAFVPLGAPGTQRVGDVLTNLKLPAAARRRACCVTDQAGVVYLAPLRIADRVRITDETRTALRIDVQPPEGRA